MFAPPVAKPKTKSTEPQRSTVVAQRPSQSAVEQVRLFQRSIGNQAMLRLLAQRGSLTGNEPGAQQEEADAARTAAQEAAPGFAWDFSKIPVVAPDRTDRPEARSLLTAPPLPGAIQAKLEIGQVDDPLEQEADSVADQVMRMPTPGVSVAATRRTNSKKSPLGRKPPPARRPPSCMRCSARPASRSTGRFAA